STPTISAPSAGDNGRVVSAGRPGVLARSADRPLASIGCAPPSGLQAVASFRGIAGEPALLLELFERQHDLAAVVAADRRHQALEEFWPVPQRRLDRGKPLAFETRRLRNFRLERALAAEGQRQIEAGLGAGDGLAQRGIERQRAE